MAETLRELVVSLSLQSDNFSKNIKSINAQIREVESRFNQAGAGVDGFAKSTDGLKAKAGVLAEKLELQKNIVGQYEQSLKKATDTLEKNKAKHETLKTTLTDQKAKYAALKSEMDKVSAALKKSVKDTGDNSEESVRLGVALEDLKTEYNALGDEIKKNEGALTQNTNTLRSNADTVSKTSDGLNKARGAQKELRAELEKTNRAIKTHQAAWLNAAENLDKFGNRATAAGQKLSRAGALLSATVTAPIVALGGAAIKASIDYESAFAGVRKTVDATEEEFAALSDTAIKMSHALPASANEIAGIMEIGGQLGIHKDALADFTRTIVDLGESTNLVGEQGATQLAKFANIAGMSQAEFGRFGSVIVDLGNNMATTEADVMNMSMRLAGAGTQVGLTEAQIAGFAAALSSVGIEAEAGGSAFSKAMINMAIAAETGGEELDDFARVSGMTAKEFQAAFKEDAAGAIQAFIVGLSQMDEQGVSTIKTLEDMGFTEVRLRDTLMRATNASGLFGNAVKIASNAWKENTALAKEAGQRYATTESRLKMLKNQATTFTRTLGDDLSPAVDDLIEMAGGWIDKLNEMEPAQRQTLMSTAAWLAAIGPGIMLIGKMNTALGSLATGFGKLIKTSVDAGGGLKGLFAATGSLLGPAGIAVLAAAAVYGAYKWYDYASGAAAAREASEAMIETAKEWQNTQAKTIYDTGNDPFARFGVDKSDFAGSIEESEDWLDRLIQTWTDGKGETNEIVKSYVDEFKAGSDEIREAITARKEAQAALGASDVVNDENIAKLKSYDDEISALLKKRQNGFLTDEEVARLNEVITLRADIELKYTTGEGSGYDTILKGVEAELARIEAEHGTVGVDLYADALKAGAQGQQAQVDALNASYREQYAVVQSIADEKQKEIALTTLNKQHQEALNAARKDYNDLVAGLAPDTFQTEEMQAAKDSVEELARKIAEVQADNVVSNDELVALKEFADTLDEGQLASYLAYIGQLKEAGLGDLDLGGGIQASSLFGGYDTLEQFIQAHSGDLSGLAEMFGAAGDEAMRVLVDMQLSDGSKSLKEQIVAWEANGVNVLINTYVADENTLVMPPPKMVEALISVYNAAVDAGVQEPNEQVEALIAAYNENPEGASVAYPKGRVDALISAYNEAIGARVAAPSQTTSALIATYTEQTGASVAMPSDAVQAFIDQYNAAVNAGVEKPNKQVDAFIANYKHTDDTTVAVPADTVDALIGAYLASGSATVADPPATVTAIISEYIAGENVKAADVPVNGSLQLTGLDLVALETWKKENPTIDLTGVNAEVGVQFGANWKTDMEALWAANKVQLYDGNGLPIDVDPSAPSPLKGSDIVLGVDENGMYHVIVSAAPTGDPVKIQYYMEEINAPTDKPFSWDFSGMDEIGLITQAGQEMQEAGNGWQNLWGLLSGKQLESLQGMVDNLDTSMVTNMLAFVQETTTAINNGEEVSQEALDNLQKIQDFVSMLETLGIGENIVAGIGQGMAESDWADPAATAAANLETALRDATGSHSPATKYIPIGKDIVGGIVKGVEDDTYKLKGAMVRMARKAVAAAKAELKIESPSRVMRDEVGVMMARGVGGGIVLGGKEQERIIANAARQMGNAALSGVRNDNRRTYNQQTTLSLAGANLYIRDEQDIRSLAIEFAALTKRQQRGMGMRMA